MKTGYMKIGEDIYTIEVVRKLKGGEAACSVEKKLIEIDEDTLKTPITNFLVALMHEVCHGLSDHFGFTFYIRSKEHSRFAEEVIEASARGFVMLMVDNTEFFEDALTKIKEEKKKWLKGSQKLSQARTVQRARRKK